MTDTQFFAMGDPPSHAGQDNSGTIRGTLSKLCHLFSPCTLAAAQREKKKKKKLLESVHDDDNFGCTGKQGPGLLLESGDGGTACLTRLPVFFSFRCYGLQMPLDDSLPL